MKQRDNSLLPFILIIGLAVSMQESAAAPNTNKSQSHAAETLEKQGCFQCHYLRGRGGLIGPPFEGIGKYRTEDDIVGVLTTKRPLQPYLPKGVLDPREFMRHVMLDKKTAQAIATYLLSIPVEEALEFKGHGEENQDDSPQDFQFTPREPSSASRKGMQVYKEAGCAACHSIGSLGGWRGPGLEGVGARLSKNAIENRIARGATVFFDGKRYEPTEFSMPPSELSEEQVKQIAEFLLTLPKKPGK